MRIPAENFPFTPRGAVRPSIFLVFSPNSALSIQQIIVALSRGEIASTAMPLLLLSRVEPMKRGAFVHSLFKNSFVHSDPLPFLSSITAEAGWLCIVQCAH